MAKLQGLYCKECGQLLGTYLADNTISSFNNIICLLCTNSLVLVCDTIGFISPDGWAGCVEQLPTEQDLIRLGSENSNKARTWHTAIQTWSKNIRNVHQAEKVRKLQNEQREIIAKEKVNQLLAKRRVG